MSHLAYSIEKHGIIVHRTTKESVPINPVLDLVCLWEHKGRSGYLLRAAKQEFELQVTPSGLVRIGPVRKAGKIRAKEDKK